MLGLAWTYVGLCWPMLDARWDYVGVIWASEGSQELIPSGIWPPKGRNFESGGVPLFGQVRLISLYMYGPFGAKKKQGSGRSPEILMVHWPFGLKFQAYKPSC